MNGERDGVVVYWRRGCVYCIKLRLTLLFTRLRYTEVNIWQAREAAAFVRSVADGNETVPTVTVAGRPLVNPSKRQLFAAVGTYAPHLLPESGGPRRPPRLTARTRWPRRRSRSARERP
ncbi:glutaredoxin domain-containing protein [Streptomyces sp. 8N706]|uniref:glutaredoxin domain-containing protein n=1 Tax=Streptomyces sp. 8N706 TaxID=3457416 RepID=UPI003FD04FE0